MRIILERDLSIWIRGGESIKMPQGTEFYTIDWKLAPKRILKDTTERFKQHHFLVRYHYTKAEGKGVEEFVFLPKVHCKIPPTGKNSWLPNW